MKYEHWFAALECLSPEKKRALRRQVPSARELYNRRNSTWEGWPGLTARETEGILGSRKDWDLEGRWEELARKEIAFLPAFHPAFPASLQEIPQPPYALYVKGKLPHEEDRAALVGARRCTPYGEAATLRFARELARRGVCIVSGLALGIDGMAHRGALQGGGRTVAVLAGGVDVCYPREHIGLYRDILEQGGSVLSEMPPGTASLPRYFPRRNRIISGLAKWILVMEARRKSGSLITADLALEQGRDVYALPGAIDWPCSSGCNGLIAQGAGILLGPEDFCKSVGIPEEPREGCPAKEEFPLEKTEKLVYNQLGFSPRSLEEIAQAAALPIPSVSALLVGLELKGLIREMGKQHYVKNG